MLYILEHIIVAITRAMSISYAAYDNIRVAMLNVYSLIGNHYGQPLVFFVLAETYTV